MNALITKESIIWRKFGQSDCTAFQTCTYCCS